MSYLHYQAYVQAMRSGDPAAGRERLHESLLARPRADCQSSAVAASREEVLRELLDEAHARIRALEAALERLKGSL
jgi:hypothetical protein